MDHDLIALMKLKESKRRRHQPQLAATTPRSNEITLPRTKMIVSQWFIDEFGNRARIIKACE